MFAFLTDTMSDEALKAKADEQYLNEFIQKNTKFVRACAFKSVHHFVTEQDDEYSIALIAFNEAIRSYDRSKGSFKSFAAMVIKRRLIDNSIKEQKFKNEMSVYPEHMDGEVEDENEATPLQLEIRQKQAEMAGQREASAGIPGGTDEEQRQSDIKDEIASVQALLEPYGFSFMDLASCSPKAAKTKRAVADAVAVLIENPAFFTMLRSNKELPMKELVKYSGAPRKLLERHRKYIIAAAEILNGEYPLLREYMDYIRKAIKT